MGERKDERRRIGGGEKIIKRRKVYEEVACYRRL